MYSFSKFDRLDVVLTGFSPVGVALLPRKSGILSSSPCTRQHFWHPGNCRPRIPRARFPGEPSHIHLRFVAPGVNSSCFHSHVPCTLNHQWQRGPSTLRRWRWNTTACSKRGSCRYWERHSSKHGGQCWETICWKHIPKKIINNKLLHSRIYLVQGSWTSF